MEEYTIILKEIDSLKTLKMPSKNGNQSCVHVGTTKYIFKTWNTCRFI